MPTTPSVSRSSPRTPPLSPHGGKRGCGGAAASLPLDTTHAGTATPLLSGTATPAKGSRRAAETGVGVVNVAGHGDVGASSSNSVSLTTVTAPYTFGTPSPPTPVPLNRSPALHFTTSSTSASGKDGAGVLTSSGLAEPALVQSPRLPSLGEGPRTRAAEAQQPPGQQVPPPPPLPAHQQAARPFFSPRAASPASIVELRSVSSSITAPLLTANTSMVSAAGSPGVLMALVGPGGGGGGGCAAAAAVAAAPLSPNAETPLVSRRSIVSTIAHATPLEGGAAASSAAATTVAAASPSAAAATRGGPPYAGVYLQPSTFRLGATGLDVLWALYRSNGIVAAYLDGDNHHEHVAAAAPTHGTAAAASEAPARLPVDDVGLAGGSGAGADAAEAVAEIARCLGAAGGSTPVLLSFDYTIIPARRRTLTELETSVQRGQPLTAQLTAKQVNALEKVAPGRAGPDESADHTDNPPTGAASAEKEAWLRGTSSGSARPGADAAGERRRVCAEVVQESLLAARRAGIAQKLAFCEPVPDGSAGPTAKGSMARVLCGGRGAADAGESQLGTGPLWLGIQAALHSMLVGEEATFLIGPADSAMFSAPMDTAAYMRSATTTGGGGGGGGVWPSGDRRRNSVNQANPSPRSVVTFPGAGTTTKGSAAAAAAVTGGSGGGGGGGASAAAAGDRTRRGRGTEGPNNRSVDTAPPSLRRRRAHSNSSMNYSVSSVASTRSSSATVASLHSSLSDTDRSMRGGASRTTKKQRQGITSRKGSQPDLGSGTPGGGSSATDAPLRKPTFLSRVRDWGRRSSRSGLDMKTTAMTPSQRPQSPNMPSSTASAPLPRGAPSKLHSIPLNGAMRSPTSTASTATPAPLFSSTEGRLGSSSFSGHLSTPGSALGSRYGSGVAFTAVHSQPPQHTPVVGPPLAKGPTPPPAAAKDVLAYEVASHASAGPVMVHLRLRERIPMLPLRTTGQQAAPLLISAELAPSRATPTTASTSFSSSIATAHAATPRTLPIGSGSSDGTAAYDGHPAPSRLSTDALLCLLETNLMRAELCTPFHHLPALSHLAPSGGGRSGGVSPHPRGATPPLGAPAAAGPPPPSATVVTVAELMRSILLRPSTRSAARTALFTAVGLAMDGKLLGACDDARTLRDAVSTAAAAAAVAAAATDAVGFASHGGPSSSEHGSAEDAALTTTSPTHTVVAHVPQVIASALTHAPTGSPVLGAVPDIPVTAAVLEERTALPGRVWVPFRALADTVKDFAAQLRRDRQDGSGGGAAGGGGTAATSPVKGTHTNAAGTADSRHRNSLLHRALHAFTQYAHETSPTEFTLSVFDASRGVYVPYVHPLRVAATTAAAATPVTVTSVNASSSMLRPHDPAVMRGGIGCVLYPCWLDAVLQSGMHRCGTDVDVVTHGHASEAEERLYVGGILQEVAGATALLTWRVKAALAAAAVSTTPPTLCAHALAGGGGGGASVDGVGGGSATPAAAPTPSTRAASTTPRGADTPAAAAVTPSRPPEPPSRRGGGGGGSRATSVAPRDHTEDTAELLARRRLAGTSQLLAARRGEVRYRVHVRSCQPLLSPQHFFALSAKDGLAAARALLVDAAVLINYYHEALATLSASSPSSTASSLPASMPASSASGLGCLHLEPTVPAVVRRGAQFEVRGQRSQHRLPYLLFGEEPRAMMAAATVRAQAMGARYSFQSAAALASAGAASGVLPAGAAMGATSASLSLSSTCASRRGGSEWMGSTSPTVSTLLSSPEVHLASPRGTPPAAPMTGTAAASASAAPPAPPTGGSAAVPPIELLAAAMMLVAPSAAAHAATLATRVPLALERVLLKALPKLHLAVFLLTFGVDEGAVVPAGLLERQHGAWWAKLSATAAVPRGSAGEGVASCVKSSSALRRESSFALASPAAAAAAVASAGAGGGGAGEDSARLQYRRYVYLGESFSHIAFLTAELPGMRAMAREACTLALLYRPRSVALWALWGTLAERLGHVTDAQDAMRVVIGLTALEEEETGGRTPSGWVPTRPPGGRTSRQLLSPVALPTAEWPPTTTVGVTAATPAAAASRGARTALVQYARGVLQAADGDAAQQSRGRRSVAKTV